MNDDRSPEASGNSSGNECNNPFASSSQESVVPPVEGSAYQHPQSTTPQNPFAEPNHGAATAGATAGNAWNGGGVNPGQVSVIEAAERGSYEVGISFKQLPEIVKRTWKIALLHLAISVVVVFVLSFISTQLLQSILGDAMQDFDTAAAAGTVGEAEQFEQNQRLLGDMMMVYMVMMLVWSIFGMIILTFQANAAHKAMSESNLAISDGFSVRRLGPIVGIGLAASFVSAIVGFTLVGPLLVFVIFYFTLAFLLEYPDASVGDCVKAALVTLKNNPAEAAKTAGIIILISFLIITVIGAVFIGLLISAQAIANVRQLRGQPLPVAA